MPRKHTDPTHKLRIWTASPDVTASFPLPLFSLPPRRRARARLRTRGSILRAERRAAEAAVSRGLDDGGTDVRPTRDPAAGVPS